MVQLAERFFHSIEQIVESRHGRPLFSPSSSQRTTGCYVCERARPSLVSPGGVDRARQKCQERIRREGCSSRSAGNGSLFLPLLLQDLQEMARAVDLVLMLTHGLIGAVRPATWLDRVPACQASGLRFTLQP